MTTITTRIPSVVVEGSPPKDSVLTEVFTGEGIVPAPEDVFWPGGEFGPVPPWTTGLLAGFPGVAVACAPGAVGGTDSTGNPPAEDCEEPETAPERPEGAIVGGDEGVFLLSA